MAVGNSDLVTLLLLLIKTIINIGKLRKFDTLSTGRRYAEDEKATIQQSCQARFMLTCTVRRFGLIKATVDEEDFSSTLGCP